MARILVVDDEMAAMTYYVAFLELSGFKVTQMKSVREARDLIEGGGAAIFDAVVLDVMLPDEESASSLGRGGIAVFQQLRTKHPDMPVVFLTNAPYYLTLDEGPRTAVFDKVACPPILLADVLKRMLRGDTGGDDDSTSSPILAVATEELARIPAGNPGAAPFHDWVFRSLRYIFTGQLSNGAKEKGLDERRKRVDIIFQNLATSGFFFDILNRNHIICPWIFVECKNYTRKAANPEIDQLAGRFSRQRGEFGMLACREVNNPTDLLKRCRDIAHAGRGYVVVLDGADLCHLLDVKSRSDVRQINAFMHERLARVIL
jgi:CheY-like chemotaxis protein